MDSVARDRESFNRFWYYDVVPDRVVRTWLRCVVPWVQLETKVGSGNPADAQHAAYLLDADVFVTADRRFASGLELLRPWAPTVFARIALIPGQGSVVEAMRAALAAMAWR